MKHLTGEQRYTISQMRRNTEHVGVLQAAISQKLSRNRNSKGQYNYRDAQMFTEILKERFSKNRKFTQEMEMFIREKDSYNKVGYNPEYYDSQG